MKRPPAVQNGRRTMYSIRFSDLAFGNGLLKPFPNDKYAGIGEAARDAVPCRNGVTENSLDIRVSRLFAPQDAHTGFIPV